MITVPEYIQLRAFARIDGAWLALLWTASFACYVLGLSDAFLGMVALGLALATPFLTVRRVKKYRDELLDGVISMRRSWAYAMFMFLYASLLFAAVQFVYFAYLDHGFFADALAQLTGQPEAGQMLAQMGMTETIDESLQLLKSMRPIDLSLNIFMANLMIGMLLNLPVAAITKCSVPRSNIRNQA